ncbi:type II secretion system protein GspL [Desulfurivibrio alkaliphilus]|uniref:General secretion pathway protein L n=1 Tax=Desulfurivibrio alkaliphilus (strain DSM 19089 / UNIQEM U267 / AHT2) TaxID=589865 RepID=D6Z6G2_DESAT|nr:type II secretion system protein GspL [Desulfurivibrio alkaliphilus]ADH86927.1 general secretion pathway protein L [Desulfurivibrio alkaliphilus AHT 2]
MKKIIVRLDERAPAECVWRKFEADGAEVAGWGSLADLAALAAGYRLWVLIPGTEVLLTRVNLPPGNRKQLLAAIPYALEEFLADEVEDQHFAVGRPDENGALAVAVIARERLDYWLELCRQHGLAPAGMVPEMLAVPLAGPDAAGREPGAAPRPSLLLTAAGAALVRTGPQDGFVLDRDSLAIMPGMPGIGNEAKLEFYHEEEAPELPEELAVLLAGSHRVGDVFALLAETLKEKEALNLLQGDYRPQAHWEKHWRRWRLPGVLVLVLLLFYAGLGLLENQRLSRYHEQLHDEIIEVYRTTFPGAQRIVNPRAQMEHQLQTLRGAGGESSARGFLPLLADSGPVLSGAAGMQLRGLRYRAGELDLELTISDLQALDELKAALEERGLEVDIRTATTRDERVLARLQVREPR